MFAAANIAHSSASPLRAIQFVWSAWAGLTRRHFYYALLAGCSLALVQGIGTAIFSFSIDWRQGFLSMFAPALLQALLLLLCLTVAARVITTRVPRWVPFVAAAAVGTLLTNLADMYIISPLSGGTAQEPFSAEWLRLMWFNVPTYMLIGVLAALGYMHWIDTQRRILVLRNMQLERTRLDREAYESRLKSLQARVEPGFLFDTLSEIETLYESSPQRAQRVLDDLIVYLRAALPSLRDDASSLSAELTLARTWLDIMQVRERDRLSYSVAGPPAGRDARMPPMVLLPLVQQAFASGGGASRDRPDVTVTADVSGARVRIVVTAARPSFAAGAGAHAIASVRERLKALHGTDATLDLRVVEGGTSEAILEIPDDPTPSAPAGRGTRAAEAAL